MDNWINKEVINSMRVLVTGGAGFIGSHVVDGFINAGYDVAVVDDLSREKQSNVNPKARLYTVDIRSPSLASVFERERPELVDHHAARTSVNHSLSDPGDDASVNVLGSINLLQNCVKFAVKQVIYASTGGALYGEPRYLPCDEDHPLHPLSPYGASKLAVERYLYIYRINWGLDYNILRYPNVYGPRQDSFAEGGVVAIFADSMSKKNPVTIFGTGQQERDFINVNDVVQANLAVVGHGNGATYNLGSGGSISINKLFQTMKFLAGYDSEAIYGPARKGEVFKIYLSTKRIRKELGWTPKVNLNNGLQTTLEYYRTT
jgi:UDP-glucose 4-epimerase